MKRATSRRAQGPRLLVVLLSLFAMFASSRANAAGLLIADGGFGGQLQIKEHDVKVTINNGIAVTTVTR